MSGFAATLAAWVAHAPGAYRPETLQRASQALVDIVGCVLAGHSERTASALAAAVPPDPWGRASAIGLSARYSAPVAALVNGTSAHALDFDDSGTEVLGHATAVLAPALFALAEEGDLSGQDVLDALIVGLELQACLGRACNPEHYAAGWHTTSTLCALGAAGACARLLRLDAEGVRYALSNCFSMIGGSKKQFGSPMKAVHAGLAAQHAVQAALFARAGISGGPEPFEGRWGFFEMFAPGLAPERLARAAEGLTEAYAIDTGCLQFKRFSCCAAAHKTLDGILTLRERIGFAVSSVVSVETFLPPVLRANLGFDRPTDEMQARFSLPYCASRVLDEGRLSLQHFSASAVESYGAEPLSRIAVQEREDQAGNPLDAPVETRMTLRTGEVVPVVIEAAKGSFSNPFTEKERRQKFADCCAFSGIAAAEALFDLVEELPKAPRIGEVLAKMAQLAAMDGNAQPVCQVFREPPPQLQYAEG